MNFFKKLTKITTQILFVIVFISFSTLNAKNLDKFNNADSISNYFSGILLLNQSKYQDSFNYLKKLDGLEKIHKNYSKNYLYSLVNSGNLSYAFNFSKKLEKEKKDSFESDIIIGVYYFKNSKYHLSKKFFQKAKKRKSVSLLDNYIAESLYIWSDLVMNDPERALFNLSQIDERFQNLKKIQKVFLSCYFDDSQTEESFRNLTSDKKTDFSRYNFFYGKYLENKGETIKAKKIISKSLKKNPRNLLLNQYKIDLELSKNSFEFNCKNKQHIVAELLYINANAFSSQSIYQVSNFYLNLSKHLNQNFHAFDILLAENFYKINDFDNSKKIYEKLTKKGIAFKWHSTKQICRILIQEKNKEKSLNLLKKTFKELYIKGLYEIFDYAEFLKNNEKFESSIEYYSNILNRINKDHPLYPEATDGRGIAYERSGEWEKAEKDFLNSLEVSPNQAYVINYLAYSWIEQGIKIEKSLSMLEKANKLKSNDPYIIDSLGWALFKLKRYEESKEYLQLALQLMPADPIVNDHYGDVLWKNGDEIQARYYWNYVLNLDDAEKDLKEKIEQKLIKGL